ncbi:MAG: hypothetical protein PVI21_06205 [Candidatus Woesebacteria bacterium]|jgi:hypothetical protein
MLVIDEGSILELILWVIVIFVVIGVIIWIIGAISDGISGSAYVAKAAAQQSKDQSQMKEILNALGIPRNGKLSSDIDEDDFISAIKIYNEKLKELLDQQDEEAAERLAKNFYSLTQFDIYLSLINDYKHAYPEAYEKVLGKNNFKVDYGDKSFFKVDTTKIVIVKDGTEAVWYSSSDDEEYVREIEVYSGKTKVLDITLKSSTGIYDAPDYSFFTVFKPNDWIIDVLEFGESLNDQIPITKQERKNKNTRERLLV